MLITHNNHPVAAAADESASEMKTVIDFGPESAPWRNVDDVVMGGVSSSRMRIEGEVAVFAGKLSLENNGGFASVRSGIIDADLAGYEGVRLRVKGDGNRYQFRIRTNANFDGPSYQKSFATTRGTWMEIELPFAEFFAAFRGRELPNEPPLDPTEIATVGILIADKQEGPFQLEIDWLKAYKKPGD